jgi:hypothetical protein
MKQIKYLTPIGFCGKIKLGRTLLLARAPNAMDLSSSEVTTPTGLVASLLFVGVS